MIELTIGEKSMQMKRERDAEGQLDWVLFDGDERLDGDPLEMTELASTLELAMFFRTIDDLDRSQLGLDAPRATFVVQMGQLKYTLLVGGEAPSPKGGAYVEVDGGSRGRVIYVVTKSTLEEFLIDPSALLTKRLATLMSPSVKSYAITSSAESYELRRGGWGGWTRGAFMLHRQGAADIRADRLQVDRLLGAIGRVQAKRFVPITKDDPPDALTIVMTALAEGEPKVHLVVAPKSKANCAEGEAYAIRREPKPVAACIKASMLEDLKVGYAELRDRRVLGTERGAIMELKLESSGTVVDLARKGDGWHMREPTEGPAEGEPTDQLLTAMLKATGTEVDTPDLAALGLDKPRATVRILGLAERTGDGDHAERVETILVGDEIDGTIHVRRKDDGVVLALSAEVGARFLPRPTLLRRTQIFEEERKYVRGLDVDCAGRRQVLKRDLGLAWTFEKPTGMETGVDGALALTLSDGLRSLQAVRWVAETAEERHGLDKPWCSVTLRLIEPDPADASGDTKITRELAVSLGAEAQGGYFAKVKDGDAVFVAPRALGNAADVWFLNRAALIPIPEINDAETVTLSSDKKTLVVRKQGDSWKIEGGGSDALAVKVKNVLEQLTAEIVEHRGAARDDAGFETPLLTIAIKLRDKPADQKLELVLGKADTWRNTPIFRIRRSDINATFLVSRARVQPLLDAL
jgi:hypothetical protein